MNMGMFLEQLNSRMPEILQEFLLDVQNAQWTERWFAEKIYQIVTLNLLSREEIEEIFGWDKGQAQRLCDFFTNQSDFSPLGYEWESKSRHKMFAILGLLASKYNLRLTMGFEPIITPLPKKVIPEPQVPWHMPLLELGWFEEVPKSAQRSLTAAGVVTLGQLLIKSEDEAYEIIHASNTVARIRNILRRQGLEFASVTPEEYQLYMDHLAVLPNAHT